MTLTRSGGEYGLPKAVSGGTTPRPGDPIPLPSVDPDESFIASGGSGLDVVRSVSPVVVTDPRIIRGRTPSPPPPMAFGTHPPRVLQPIPTAYGTAVRLGPPTTGLQTTATSAPPAISASPGDVSTSRPDRTFVGDAQPPSPSIHDVRSLSSDNLKALSSMLSSMSPLSSLPSDSAGPGNRIFFEQDEKEKMRLEIEKLRRQVKTYETKMGQMVPETKHMSVVEGTPSTNNIMTSIARQKSDRSTRIIVEDDEVEELTSSMSVKKDRALSVPKDRIVTASSGLPRGSILVHEDSEESDNDSLISPDFNRGSSKKPKGKSKLIERYTTPEYINPTSHMNRTNYSNRKHVDDDEDNDGNESEYSIPSSIHEDDPKEVKYRKRKYLRNLEAQKLAEQRNWELKKLGMSQELRAQTARPEKYDGAADLEKWYHWMRSVEEWITNNCISTENQISRVKAFLTNKALRFYLTEVQYSESSFTLTRFFRKLFDHCFPNNWRISELLKFRNSKQNGSSL